MNFPLRTSTLFTFVRLLLFGLLSVAVLDTPEPVTEPPQIPHIKKEDVHNWYFRGKFDKVTELLETYRSSGQPVTREDSVVIFKYLGIVYASKPQGKLKGEGFLYSLLKVDPHADMKDMHLSEDLEELFENVRQRFKEDNPDLDAEKQAEPVSPGPGEKKASKMPPWVWWTAGGAVAAGAVVTATVLLLDTEEEAPNIVEADVQ